MELIERKWNWLKIRVQLICWENFEHIYYAENIQNKKHNLVAYNPCIEDVSSALWKSDYAPGNHLEIENVSSSYVL